MPLMDEIEEDMLDVLCGYVVYKYSAMLCDVPMCCDIRVLFCCVFCHVVVPTRLNQSPHSTAHLV